MPNRHQRPIAFVAVVTAMLTCACASIPAGRSAIDRVAIQGTDQLDDDDIKEKIAAADSPKFLGLFRGVVYDYELLDRVALQRDLARVERYCRAKGFYDCRVRAGRIRQIAPHHVRVEIAIDEGQPSKIAKLYFEGLEELPPATQDEFKSAASELLPVGSVFEEEQFARAEQDLKKQLADEGYAHVEVKASAAVDVVRHSVDIVVSAKPGPKAVFGAITLEGLGGLPRGPVLRAIDIDAGDPYSQSALESARQAALDLGVFSSVEMIPELGNSTTTTVIPVRVKVEVSKLRAVRIGGGVELDPIKTDVHLVLGWEDHNFLGALRQYSVSVKPGVVLYPLRINSWQVPQQFLPEVKVINQLRRSGFIEARTTGFIRLELSAFPVLLKTDPRPSDPIPGYVEFKAVAGVERTIKRLYGRLSHTVQVEDPFSYKDDVDGALRVLVLSYPELVTNLSLTDNRVRPHRGIALGNTVQFAGGPFGGDADDVSLQPDARVYVPATHRVTIAARASVGLLFPRNYGFSAQNSGSLVDPAVASARARDEQILFFRGLFAGGPNSNRGYPLRGIGPRGFVAAYNAGGIANLAACGGTNAADIARDCQVPIGGLTRWEASTEARFNLAGPVSSAIFCDAADVSANTTDIRLMRLHLSCGLGGRYDTPVGPIRLDIGYRIPHLQVLNGPDTDEEPAPLFGIFPVAIAFGIGEAF
ncbi:MAG TPA: BamA/TamA family outer membrane protein [Polyangiaceae bacterium]|nr:BamA/TamA family outer membrane protein [Polyangiaceae bacterium]